MSYILDALRRSESERQLDSPPSIHQAVEPSASVNDPPRLRRRRWWPALAMVLLGLAAVLLLYAALASKSPSVSQPSAGGSAPPAELLPGAKPARAAPVPQPTPVVEQVPVATKPPGIRLRDLPKGHFPQPQAQNPRQPPVAEARLGGRPAQETESEEGASDVAAGTNSEASDDRRAAVEDEPQQRSVIAPSAEAADPPSVTDDLADVLRTAKQRLQAPPSAPGTEPAVAGAAPANLLTLPQSQRSGVPSVQISTHVYARRPGSRRVRINGEMLKEGARLANGLELVEITPKGVVLRGQSEPFSFLVGQVWKGG